MIRAQVWPNCSCSALRVKRELNLHIPSNLTPDPTDCVYTSWVHHPPDIKGCWIRAQAYWTNIITSIANPITTPFMTQSHFGNVLRASFQSNHSIVFFHINILSFFIQYNPIDFDVNRSIKIINRKETHE